MNFQQLGHVYHLATQLRQFLTFFGFFGNNFCACPPVIAWMSTYPWIRNKTCLIKIICSWYNEIIVSNHGFSSDIKSQRTIYIYIYVYIYIFFFFTYPVIQKDHILHIVFLVRHQQDQIDVFSYRDFPWCQTTNI